MTNTSLLRASVVFWLGTWLTILSFVIPGRNKTWFTDVILLYVFVGAVSIAFMTGLYFLMLFLVRKYGPTAGTITWIMVPVLSVLLLMFSIPGSWHGADSIRREISVLIPLFLTWSLITYFIFLRKGHSSARLGRLIQRIKQSV